MGTIRRDPATAHPVPLCQEERAREALALMVEALGLIDSTEGAGVAGAHLDLAIHRLQEWIGSAEPK